MCCCISVWYSTLWYPRAPERLRGRWTAQSNMCTYCGHALNMCRALHLFRNSVLALCLWLFCFWLFSVAAGGNSNRCLYSALSSCACGAGLMSRGCSTSGCCYGDLSWEMDEIWIWFTSKIVCALFITAHHQWKFTSPSMRIKLNLGCDKAE